MRKHNYPEGAEFSHDDYASWEQLTILKGQVVEVELTDPAGDFPADLWAGFLSHQGGVGSGRRHDITCEEPWKSHPRKMAFNKLQPASRLSSPVPQLSMRGRRRVHFACDPTQGVLHGRFCKGLHHCGYEKADEEVVRTHGGRAGDAISWLDITVPAEKNQVGKRWNL